MHNFFPPFANRCCIMAFAPDRLHRESHRRINFYCQRKAAQLKCISSEAPGFTERNRITNEQLLQCSAVLPHPYGSIIQHLPPDPKSFQVDSFPELLHSCIRRLDVRCCFCLDFINIEFTGRKRFLLSIPAVFLNICFLLYLHICICSVHGCFRCCASCRSNRNQLRKNIHRKWIPRRGEQLLVSLSMFLGIV